MKARMFKLLAGLMPQRYVARAAELLTDASVTRLDYDKHEILMYKGIRNWQCSKEPDVVAWIETELAPGDVFYDIGANVGPFSIIAAKYHQGSVKTYAFEPAYNNIDVLVTNIIMNKCQGNVFPIIAPLSDVAGMSEFNYKTVQSGAGLHTLGEPRVQSQFNGEVYQPVFKNYVLTTTIDDLVYKHGIEPPNHIKLDVDGYEYNILKGAARVLEEGKTRSCIVEIADETSGRLINEFLGRYGYKVAGERKRLRVSNRVFKKE